MVAAQFAVDAPDLGAHLQPQLGVEVGQRLVHQHQRRLDDDGARDGHALLLAARQLAGQLVRLVVQLHQVQRLGFTRCADLGGRHAAHRRPKPTLRATLMCGNSA
jgi:hypothetical protein